ncbi:MAG: hypothetical protein IJM66_09875 [Muribaculaceae bacterium]|nr:hypothetical protein [Muribaculaceae bacterium]
MKLFFNFSALFFFAMVMAACTAGTVTSGSSSWEDSTSMVEEALVDTAAHPQAEPVTDNTVVDEEVVDTYNENEAKAFATQFFNDNSSDELVTFKKYMTPELYAKCKHIIDHIWVENLDQIPFSEWQPEGIGKHITKPGVFISSLGDGKFKAVYSDESDFAGDEGGYSNQIVRIKVGKVDGEYKVIDIFNYYPKNKWVLNK